MTDKPAKHLDWANQGIEPSTGLKNSGYAPGSIPASSNFNWYFYTIDQWQKWAQENIDALLLEESSEWFSGSGVPGSGTGEDGDFYLNTSNGDVYKKTSGSWGSPIMNLTGPQGATGATGAQGPTGAKGDQGDPGPGLPAGGTTGQLIRKASDVTDYDTEWFDPDYVVGPDSSTDQGIPVFDGSGGHTLQSSNVTIDEYDNVAGVNDLETEGNVDVGGNLGVAQDAVIEGNALIKGDLEVQGTTTTLNTEDLQVEDHLIQLNYGGTDASADDGGIEILGDGNAAIARLQYDKDLPSKFKAGAAGSESEILNVDATQTIKNKTIDNSNSAELDDDEFTLQDPADSSKKIRFDAGNTTAGQTRVISFPDADAEMVGKDTSQTVKNKIFQDSDFDGGTASNSRRLTVPSGTYSSLLALNRKAGTLLWATDLNLMFRDDGTNLIPDRTGQGIKNYIANPSAAVSIAGWAISGPGTLARTTSGSVLPRRYTTGTAFQFTSSTNGEFVYNRFILDDVDIGRRIQNLIDYISSSSNFRVEVYKNPDGAWGEGTSEEVPLLTDVSGDSYLAAASDSESFLTQFDTDDKIYMELRIVHNGTGTDTIYFSDVLVGPGTLIKGPVIGKWQSYTPTLTNFGGATLSTGGGLWRIVGDTMELRVGFATTGAGSGSSPVEVSLPAGYTIDESRLPRPTSLNSSQNYLGVCTLYRGSTSTYDGAGEVVPSTSNTALRFTESGTGSAITGADFSSPSELNFFANIPILELANSASVNLLNQNTQSPIKAGTVQAWAGATVPTGWLECDGSAYAQTAYPQLYAELGSTWNTCTNPLTGSAYSAPAAGYFRVPDLRGVFLRGVGTFSDGIGTNTTLAGYQADQMQGHYHSATHNVPSSVPSPGVLPVHRIVGTQEGPQSGDVGLTVTAPSTDGTNGTPRTGKETRPRNVGVKFIIKAWDESFNLAGFAEATADRMGLVQGGKVPGQTSGPTIEAGKIGEIIRASVNTLTDVPTAGTYGDAVSITLTKGLWRIDAKFFVNRNSATLTANGAIVHGVSTTPGNTDTGLNYPTNVYQAIYINLNATNQTIPQISFLVYCDGTKITRIDDNTDFAAGTTLYHKIYCDGYSVATPLYRSNLVATRVG